VNEVSKEKNETFEVGDLVLYDEEEELYIAEVTRTHYSLVEEDGKLYDTLHVGDGWKLEMVQKEAKPTIPCIKPLNERAYVLEESEDGKPKVIEINGVFYHRK